MECTKLNCPMQVGTVTENCGDSCPWRTTVKLDDLISRAAAIEYLMTNMGWHDEDGYEVDDADEKRSVITDLVNGIPSVDAAPVVHGRWIHCDGKSHIWYCSNCGEKVNYNNAHKVYAKSTRPIEEVNHFCRNCGAKMDEEG